MEVTFGGDNAERNEVSLPNYFEPGEADFEEVLIQINYQKVC